MYKMQDAKTEADGSTLKYVTEADDEVRMEQMSQAAQQFVCYDTRPFFCPLTCDLVFGYL